MRIVFTIALLFSVAASQTTPFTTIKVDTVKSKTPAQKVTVNDSLLVTGTTTSSGAFLGSSTGQFNSNLTLSGSGTYPYIRWYDDIGPSGWYAQQNSSDGLDFTYFGGSTYIPFSLSYNLGIYTGVASSQAGRINFYNASNSNILSLISGVSASSFTLTLPTSAGSSGQFLQTNGSGVMSWATPSTTTAGGWTDGGSNVYQTTAGDKVHVRASSGDTLGGGILNVYGKIAQTDSTTNGLVAYDLLNYNDTTFSWIDRGFTNTNQFSTKFRLRGTSDMSSNVSTSLAILNRAADSTYSEIGAAGSYLFGNVRRRTGSASSVAFQYYYDSTLFRIAGSDLIKLGATDNSTSLWMKGLSTGSYLSRFYNNNGQERFNVDTAGTVNVKGDTLLVGARISGGNSGVIGLYDAANDQNIILSTDDNAWAVKSTAIGSPSLNLFGASGSYQINSTSVLNASTLGSGVTSSSLTSVGALASGSIAAGFTAIDTAYTNAVSNVLAGTNTSIATSGKTKFISASSGMLTAFDTTRIDYLDRTQTIAGAKTFSAATTINNSTTITAASNALKVADNSGTGIQNVLFIQQSGASDPTNYPTILFQANDGSGTLRTAGSIRFGTVDTTTGAVTGGYNIQPNLSGSASGGIVGGFVKGVNWANMGSTLNSNSGNFGADTLFLDNVVRINGTTRIDVSGNYTGGTVTATGLITGDSLTISGITRQGGQASDGTSMQYLKGGSKKYFNRMYSSNATNRLNFDTTGAIEGGTFLRDTASFSGTNTRVAVYIPGATPGDNYTVTPKNTLSGTVGNEPLPVAGDLLIALAKTDSLIVRRPASGTSGLKFFIQRIK